MMNDVLLLIILKRVGCRGKKSRPEPLGILEISQESQIHVHH